ncbi:hypothetical protein HALLA_03125 (plasmid) [Halostagnicola larsenii XH-48]|uniref:DolP-mannose mannosyltransferase n=1 Tax=Halostagnicola larsenii XH-48 TaxID=797299 RepID=W0JWG5_9EURY|nr:DolP-mannose mannosyltransferase [Halostagnicola larsenii]AHG01393.1 hypothetical protein HALLA_03125 [Halostagnicola larsenii XH-48]
MSPRSLSEIRVGWLVVLGPIVAVLFTAGSVCYLQTRWPTIATDPAFFQHTGWYIVQGGVPYVDVWDVNPPVPFGITAVLAVLSGGDMLVLHGLSTALTVLVAAASVLLVGWIAYLVTEEHVAAIAAGLTMLIVPELLVLSLEGVRAQFYALFFGTLALALVLRDRPFLAGVLAALSAGSWQSGAVFAPLIVGMAYQRNGGRDALSAIAGGGLVTGIVVGVFAAVGALVPMVVQSIIAPLSAGSPYTLAERVYSILLVFGYGAVLFPVAIYGWGRAVARDLGAHWWLPVGGVLLTLQVLFVDLDGSTDAFLLLSFIALGVAVTVERVLAWRSLSTDPQRGDENQTNRNLWTGAVIVMLVAVLVLGGVVWHLDSPAPKQTLQTNQLQAEPPGEDLPITPADGNAPSMQTIYWDQLQPETCHYRLSWNEIRWVAMTDDRLDAQKCDGWPSRTDTA